ncbi:MAG: dihydrofolate reductase family protein [Mycobacterium sp.]|uniref:dihydrofolate reductase family protein n=1 Tax=Mycobacterium sp. TaxID=1785 RepID=UPI003C5E87FC
MRIVLSDFMSLDGVVQAPGGREEDTDGGFAHGGWSIPFFEPETMGPAVNDVMAGTEALLFGRRTWQAMAAAWPSRAGDPFADRMNQIPKYVASRTLTPDDLTWPGSTLLPAPMRSARSGRCARRTARRCKSWAARRWPHS